MRDRKEFEKNIIKKYEKQIHQIYHEEIKIDQIQTKKGTITFNQTDYNKMFEKAREQRKQLFKSWKKGE